MEARTTTRTWLPTLLILLAGILLFVLNLVVGSVSVPLSEFWAVVTGHGDETYRTIILEYRLPQAITALFAGIGLSVSGLLMQTLFRNPLADPSILGISSGASLGVAIVASWWEREKEGCTLPPCEGFEAASKRLGNESDMLKTIQKLSEAAKEYYSKPREKSGYWYYNLADDQEYDGEDAAQKLYEALVK